MSQLFERAMRSASTLQSLAKVLAKAIPFFNLSAAILFPAYVGLMSLVSSSMTARSSAYRCSETPPLDLTEFDLAACCWAACAAATPCCKICWFARRMFDVRLAVFAPALASNDFSFSRSATFALAMFWITGVDVLLSAMSALKDEELAHTVA